MPMTVDQSLLNPVLSRKVYFGHQSVGNNMMSGVESLKKSGSDLAKLRAVEIQAASEIAGPGIYHSKIGKNRDTQSKIQGFEEILKSGVGEAVDVAVMKFCYVDIVAETDVKALFSAYREAMERIQKRHPKLTLLHATVPLTVHGSGLRGKLRAWIKGDATNARRMEYNELVRNHFGKEGKVFDIAAAESTLADGTRVTFRHDGRICEAISPKYAAGAGHLNDAGGQHVAAEFLRTIGRSLNSSPL